jgi:hypothetical protein
MQVFALDFDIDIDIELIAQDANLTTPFIRQAQHYLPLLAANSFFVR